MDAIRPLPVVVAPTTDRKTERGRFENALRGAAQGVAGTITQSLSLAAPFIPGGPVLAGAIRGAASPQPSALGATTGGAGGARGSVSAPGAQGAGAVGSAVTAAASAGSEGDMLEATRALQAEAQSFNLQYLQLQESMQRESREFTAVSNVMKVRHETAKTAIQNVH
jgi:hypothetical protein